MSVQHQLVRRHSTACCQCSTLVHVCSLKYSSVTVLLAAGGTFALYSLITRYAHISTPASSTPNASDLHLSRYTSNSMIEQSERAHPKTTSERVRWWPSCYALRLRAAFSLPSKAADLWLMACIIQPSTRPAGKAQTAAAKHANHTNTYM